MTRRVIMVMTAVAFCAMHVYAGDAPPVSSLLTDDGHFDLEQARQSGFEGAVDLAGYGMSIDPQSHAPVFDVQSMAPSPEDCWDGGFTLPGADGRIYCSVLYNGLLVVGGAFNVIGDAVAHGIAGWDGTAWHSFGDGMNNDVYALTVFNGELIAGGNFSFAGGR